MLTWLAVFFDRLCSVAGAFIFSQIPLFMQQYQQHLAARLAELSKHVQGMRDAAKLSGKTLQQYILKFLQSGDADFSRQGQIIQEMADRWKELGESLKALSEASPLSHPWVFGTHIDFEIARSTLDNYSFGVPLTFEGLLYAIAGMGIGLLLFKVIRKLGKAFVYCFRYSCTSTTV